MWLLYNPVIILQHAGKLRKGLTIWLFSGAYFKKGLAQLEKPSPEYITGCLGNRSFEDNPLA